MRSIFRHCLGFAVGFAPFVLSGCGQAPAGSEVGTTDNGADQALTAVDTCQDQAQACRADGGGDACQDQLRSCLMAINPPGAGQPPGQPEAGEPPSSPPGLGDGGPPGQTDVDDSGPSHGNGDAGQPPHPPRPDAAVAALTNPVGNDGGSPTLQCVDAMHRCLATAARPDTCAASFKTCVAAIVDAKHADAAAAH